MNSYKYKWFKINMYVACLRCGNKLPMQSTQGSPTCDDCGEVAPQTWEDVCKTGELEDIRKGETGNKKIFGNMEISMNTDIAKTVSCNHCQAVLDLKIDPVESNACECPACKKELLFEKLKAYDNILFYRFAKQKLNHENKATTIAVRCAACGAPIETDPGKVNYNCNFCGVENILPVSLRQRRVLDDVFAGVQKKILSGDKMLEAKDPQLVFSSLNESSAGDFSDEILNALAIRFCDNGRIFNLIKDKMKLNFSDDALAKIWERSTAFNSINFVGKKLNKAEGEIKKRVQQLDPDYKHASTDQNDQNKQKNKNKNSGGFLDKLKNLFG